MERCVHRLLVILRFILVQGFDTLCIVYVRIYFIVYMKNLY